MRFGPQHPWGRWRLAERYAKCMTVQLVTRVPDELIASLDDLVRDGHFASRSEAVRTGLTAVVEQQRRRAVGQAIVDGYRHAPQTGADEEWSDAASAAMIAEEPW